jgi:alpha-beta hydrolase superfamily lysophospholipase
MNDPFALFGVMFGGWRWSDLPALIVANWLWILLALVGMLLAWWFGFRRLVRFFRRRRLLRRLKVRSRWHWGPRLNRRLAPGREDQRPRCLVVFVHGLFPYVAKRRIYHRLLDHFDDVLRSRFKQRDYLLFKHHGVYWSPRDPEWIVRNQLLPQIVDVTNRTDYDTIILAAHSFGGLLVRQLVLDARNLPWYGKVERIVLMASPNRGFSPVALTHKVLELFAWGVLDRPEIPAWLRLGHLTLCGLKGAPWVSDLRLRWIMAFSSDQPPPLTFQILGGRDGLVSPDDDDDLRKFPNFHPKLLPFIGHGHFSLELRRKRSKESNKRNRAALKELRDVIAQALTQPHFERFMPKSLVPPPDHIVMIVHGIRDFAEWHEDLAEAIRRLNTAAGGPRYEPHSIGYGYFSAYQFLSNRARHYCVRTLVDRYVQLRIKYPDATFHVIAHSNGTFAVGMALQEYRFVSFQHVYFAGSVLTQRFDWQSLFLSGDPKTHRVLNLCTDGDQPVGVFCWALSIVRFLYGTLGTAGISGFEQGTDDLHSMPTAGKPKIWNEWIAGDHNSGVRRNNFSNIAEFIRTGLPQRKRATERDEMPIQRITEPRLRMSRAVFWGRCVVVGGFFFGIALYGGLCYLLPWQVIILTAILALVVGLIDFLLVY